MNNKDVERGYTNESTDAIREKGREEGATPWNKGAYDALYGPGSEEHGGFIERNNTGDRL